MLPDDKVMCHRTGFQISCLDGVTKHKCRLWCHVSGTDAQGHDIDVFGCADELSIKFLHEIAKEERQTAASVDKVATEVKRSSDEAAMRDVYLSNGPGVRRQIWQQTMEHADKLMLEDERSG